MATRRRRGGGGGKKKIRNAKEDARSQTHASLKDEGLVG